MRGPVAETKPDMPIQRILLRRVGQWTRTLSLAHRVWCELRWRLALCSSIAAEWQTLREHHELRE